MEKNVEKIEDKRDHPAFGVILPYKEEKPEVNIEESQKKPNIIKRLAKRWFIDAFTGMAFGLFATLIAGTIISQIGTLVAKYAGTDNAFALFITSIGTVAKILMGAGIGAGIAYMLKADKLTIFSCMVAGFIGANGKGLIALSVGVGNPISAYITALVACEICKLIAGRTKLDIVIIPLLAMAIAGVLAIYVCPYVNFAIDKLAEGIAIAMDWNPAVMGIVIAVVMGILLTMPTSSAAIWISIATTNPDNPMLLLAGGAAVVGCSAQMIGFAVQSFRENGFGGFIAQGLGTSMLQIPNIMRKPVIIVPPIIASAVVGPLATCVFKLKCNAAGGGMGTSGLVGVFGVLDASSQLSPVVMWLGIVLLMFVLPGVITLIVSELFRKFGWIKYGDMALDLGKKKNK